MENKMSSTSSTEDEINDLFKEAASCDYVNKLYNNTFNIQKDVDKPSKNIDSDGNEETTITSHQLFIAKRLIKRLDQLIELVDNPVDVPEVHSSSTKGIKLFKDSVYIDNFEEDTTVKISRYSNPNLLSEKDYLARANEAAVTFDWVSSKANTRMWCSNKKPKIINMKVVKKLGEKVECDIISTINIKEKYRLI